MLKSKSNVIHIPINNQIFSYVYRGRNLGSGTGQNASVQRQSAQLVRQSAGIDLVAAERIVRNHLMRLLRLLLAGRIVVRPIDGRHVVHRWVRIVGHVPSDVRLDVHRTALT